MSEPKRKEFSGKALAAGGVPLLYAAGGWLAQAAGPAQSKSCLLTYILISNAVLWPWYLWLRALPCPPLQSRWGALIACASVILSPSLMQTDQLRYIWDGINLGRGHNPYALSPAEGLAMEHSLNTPHAVRSPAGLDIPDHWARAINHPQLPTVYSPVAQLFFGLSAWLNPFFSIERINTLFPQWMRLFPTLIWWPWELGLRLVVGCALAALVLILRNHRWDLVALHPLIFLTGSANLHVDALLLPFLALCFFAMPREPGHSPGLPKPAFGAIFPGAALLLGITTLVRWTPLLMLPAFFVTWRRRQGLQHAFLSLAVWASTLACGFALFMPGSRGRLFESSVTYVEQWYFFGFVHRILADAFEALGLFAGPIQAAKAVLGALWLAFAAWLAVQSSRGRFSLSLTSLILLCSFLAVVPTLHPWYLLPLLVVGHRYMTVLWTPWLWPMLAPMSYAYYFDNADPTALRLAVYAIVTLGFVRDSLRIFRPQASR